MTEDSGLEEITGHIRAYARKDTFRQLRESSEACGKTTFTFSWLSTRGPLRLVFEPRTHTLALDRFFPRISPPVEEAVKEFVRERSGNSGLPDHKWVDPSKLSMHYVNRDGDGSLVFSIHRPDAREYAVRKFVNLTNEMFFRLQLSHGDYMLQAFGGSDE